MSTIEHCRSGSDSWSVMPQTEQDGPTDTAAAAATAATDAATETHEAYTSVVASQVPLLTAAADDNGEQTAEMHAEDADENASQHSAESWVELTAADLESPSNAPLLANDASSVAAPAVEAEETCTTGLCASDAHLEEVDKADSATVLLVVPAVVEEDSEAAQPACTSAPLSIPSPPPLPVAAPAAAQQVRDATDLSLFFSGLSIPTLSANASEAKPLTEREAADQVFLSFAAAAEPTDDFTRLAAEAGEMEETVSIIDLDPSCRTTKLQQSGVAAASRRSTQHGRVRLPPPTGDTQVLRRRVVAEDWLRTTRGPSELTPEERVAVFQALFGDAPDVPISAERFKELMVPFERHCDCLGASYGFHHHGCQFFNGAELTS